MIPSDFIDELLAKVDIVDIVSEHVPLKKGGANYMACCPFHKEKSPSFSVSPTKQFYHCFGCGVHGSAIGFIMEHQGLSFTEAVQYLADRVGMRVPRHAGQQENPEQRAARKQKQQSLEDTMQACASFYAQQLKIQTEAQAYFQKRGLNADIIAHYGLGYAPDAWQGLAQVFQPYPNPLLIEGGQVIENEEKNSHYDRFRHRVMFPIRDVRGQVIGFGGRVLDDSKPKYLNSPDTPLFDKGRNLYGLHEARAAIKESARVLVVEGYMDVVALAQFGIGYAVAALGTATTAEHIKLLMRQSDNIYFCFDGDAAGRKAAWRALENALPQLKDDKSLHFLFLPSEHDPDSYVRAFGKAQFEDALLNQSKTLSAYFWDALCENIDLSSNEGKSQLIKTAAPLLQQINAPALGFLLKQELSQLTGVDPSNLAYLLGQEAPKQHVAAKSYRLPRETFRQPQMPTLVQKQIHALLHHPEWAAQCNFPDYIALTGELACLAHIIELLQHNPQLLHLAQIVEHFRDSEHQETINNILKNNELNINQQHHKLKYESSLSDKEQQAQELQNAEMEQQAFSDGMTKLLQEVNLATVNHLRQKASNGGLNEQEKQLLLQLLSKK
ncbi:MAG: DNA primase [Neisseria sp.]|nr:DNA primase [Neisseria sp.]